MGARLAATARGRPQHWKPLGLLLAVATLAGCTSSDGGSGASPGGGQSPDPVVLDFPIAYVKRPVPTGAALAPDARELLPFQPGADLYLRDRASPSSAERNLTAAITKGLGDVRDVEPSYDGRKLVFALHEPKIVGASPDEQPTWDIWEYDLDAQLLRRVFTSDTAAREGDDVAPHYLPDGRIVFSSTRQRQSKAILLDEGKPQFAAQDENDDEHAFVLHVMNADGSGIRQVSFNQSHDLDPAVLPDGRIVFSRWDNAPGHDEISLYTMRPDGGDLQLLYGARSHATGTGGEDVHFLDPRPMANGKLLVRVQPFEAPDLGGQLLEVDTANYVEITQPTLPNRGVLAGPAQVAATINDVRTIAGPSPGGRYNSAFPLQDGTGRILLTWTQCRLLETATGSTTAQIVPCTADRLAAGAASTAAPLYGVWIYDPAQKTQLPVSSPVEGTLFTDIVALQPRALPAVLLDPVAGVDFDADLEAEGVGLLDVRSVYDIAGTDTAPGGIVVLRDPARTLAAARPARFVRIEKAVSIPDDDVRDFDRSAFGVTRAFGMREILGYAPVEPDGSVRIKVPADVAFAISVLDANGRRIGGRHDNWLQLRAGQELKCNGCHVATRADSHGRDNLFAAANTGAPGTGVPFPNTNPAFFADFGETMAQVRARISCQTDCADLEPSTSIRFADVWTDPVAAGRPADAPFAYDYADLATPAPTTPDCVTSWRAGCRITIHYERHIHPLWSKPRVTLAADGTVLRDDTCVACHSARAADGSARVPAAQLELTDGPSADVPTQFHAYRELLATDAEQQVVNGTLQDRLVQTGIDPVTGLPLFSTVPVAPALRAGSANSSVTFFSLFAPGGTHAGRLTPAELKLVSEWTDIGAQYFNDPFAAPLN
jgi:Hydrazine synthase alpha subunit middle domain/WD40-like Beta Propeller Repeat